jgi:hypothetical protein
MKTRIMIVVLVAIGVGFAMGFLCRPFISDVASDDVETIQTLTFESTVNAYSYSESGIIGIKKIDDRNYVISAMNPGMCVLSFSTVDDSDIPSHTRNGRFIVSVSPNKSLTIQKTKYAAGGML